MAFKKKARKISDHISFRPLKRLFRMQPPPATPLVELAAFMRNMQEDLSRINEHAPKQTPAPYAFDKIDRAYGDTLACYGVLGLYTVKRIDGRFQHEALVVILDALPAVGVSQHVAWLVAHRNGSGDIITSQDQDISTDPYINQALDPDFGDDAQREHAHDSSIELTDLPSLQRILVRLRAEVDAENAAAAEDPAAITVVAAPPKPSMSSRITKSLKRSTTMVLDNISEVSEDSVPKPSIRGTARDYVFVVNDPTLIPLVLGPGQWFKSREYNYPSAYPVAAFPGVFSGVQPASYKSHPGRGTRPNLLHVATIIQSFIDIFPHYSLRSANCYSLTGTTTRLTIETFPIDDSDQSVATPSFPAGSFHGGKFIPLYSTRVWAGVPNAVQSKFSSYILRNQLHTTRNQLDTTRNQLDTTENQLHVVENEVTLLREALARLGGTDPTASPGSIRPTAARR